MPKLSEDIEATLRWIERTDAIDGRQVMTLIDFMKRHLPHLHAFALDFEKAELLAPSEQAVTSATAAAMRLYRRLEARGEPVEVMRFPAPRDPAPLPEVVIDLDKYRRGTRPSSFDGGAS